MFFHEVSSGQPASMKCTANFLYNYKSPMKSAKDAELISPARVIGFGQNPRI